MSARNAPPATMADVIEAVVANPGMSVGIDGDQLQSIWRALGEYVEDSLCKKRSIIVPGFCHFLLQEQVNHMGNWDTRNAWIPGVIPVEQFTRAFGLRTAAVFNQAHVGAKRPTFMNGCHVATLAGMPRNPTVNGISDLVRTIGTFIYGGRRLEVELGFVLLEFSQKRMSVRWSQRFLDKFADALGTATSHATRALRADNTFTLSSALSTVERVAGHNEQPPRSALKQQAAPNDLSASKLEAAAEEQREEDFPEQQPSKPQTPVSLEDSPRRPPVVARTPPIPEPPQTARIPQPPRPTPPGTPAGGSRPRSARPMAQECSTPRNDRSGLSTPLSSPRRATSSASPRRGVSASPRMNTKDIDDIMNNVPKTPNTFLRRKARKTLYRRMRNRSYEESWEAMKAMKEAEAAEEAREDREKVARFRQLLVEEKLKDQADRANRRTESRDIQRLNLELADVRDQLKIPKIQQPGDIFDARVPHYTAAHDMDALHQQMRLKEERKEQERADDKKYGDLAVAIAQQARDEALEEKKKRRAYGRLHGQLHRDEIARREEERREYRMAKTNGGALLFSGNDGKDAERRDVRAVKEQTKKYQDENKRTTEDRAAAQRDFRKSEKIRHQKMYVESAEQNAMLREQEARQDAAKKAMMRAAWDEQIAERNNGLAREKFERQTWKEMNYLRNESSEDDD